MSERRRLNLESFRMMTEVWPEPRPAKPVRLPVVELIEEVDHLIGSGAMPWEVPALVGYQLSSLVRLLQRHHRNDLANRIQPYIAA